MRFSAVSACLALVAAVGSAGVATGTAEARPAGATSLYAPSAVVLSVGKGEDPATATMQRTVVLRCSPSPYGDHPDPVSACAELRSVQGDFAALTAGPSGVSCTRIWDPVVVTADGVWEGRRVTFSRAFGNACMLRGSDTRGVFAF
ncbi:subtilase-type protease inhibitor [Streptomyces sp. NPDC088733]|uniref:subtilase-type protease inhibitor n=1 Tax=Streptomyces sp. NPDC088733 TaxID=3365880 RepID=UPI00380CCF3D